MAATATSRLPLKMTANEKTATNARQKERCTNILEAIIFPIKDSRCSITQIWAIDAVLETFHAESLLFNAQFKLSAAKKIRHDNCVLRQDNCRLCPYHFSMSIMPEIFASHLNTRI
jgi:hypothetical protein